MAIIYFYECQTNSEHKAMLSRYRYAIYARYRYSILLSILIYLRWCYSLNLLHLILEPTL